MAKSSRFQHAYRANASKRHKIVGEILRNSPYFCNYHHYQEYPVSRVNQNYSSGREHFDWVVPSLKLVIEVHGEQHYTPVQFGDMTAEAAVEAFHDCRRRDLAKENAAVEAGWTYIAIFPDVVITPEWIIKQYEEYFNPKKLVTSGAVSMWADKYKQVKEARKESGKYEEDKETARLLRKAQYKKQKEWKKANSKNGL